MRRKEGVEMMGMRKLMGLLLGACLLTAGLAGCGGQGGSGSSGAPAQSTTLQQVKDRGVLKVGIRVDVPRLGYKDPATGKIEGLEIDLAHLLAKKILGDENKVELIPVTAKSRGALIDNGDIDATISIFTITDERKKSYNFSAPYYVDHVGLMVKKDSGINSLKDMDGKTVGSAQGSTAGKAVMDEAKKEGINIKVSEFASHTEIKSALEAGRVDAHCGDIMIISGYYLNNPDYKVLPDRFMYEEQGIVTKKNNTELAKAADDLIKELDQSGQLKQMREKWGFID